MELVKEIIEREKRAKNKKKTKQKQSTLLHGNFEYRGRKFCIFEFEPYFSLPAWVDPTLQNFNRRQLPARVDPTPQNFNWSSHPPTTTTTTTLL